MPSICPARKFRFKFTGDPDAGECDRVMGPWCHATSSSSGARAHSHPFNDSDKIYKKSPGATYISSPLIEQRRCRLISC